MPHHESASESRHVPVLPAEVLTWLDPQQGQVLVDATVGAAGHTRLLASRIGLTGRLIGLDQDGSMLNLAKGRTWPAGSPEVTLLQGNFDNLRQVLDELQIDRIDGVLADLGFASDQVENPERGFSFQEEGPLDMRLNAEDGQTASELLARLDERSLADVFWEFGEERFSRRIARRIVETRKQSPLTTTTQLADLVRRCVPWPKGKKPRIDPATRVFQALRIAVNDELGALERLLAALPKCLKPGGRAVIISFHSLEDRRVKQAFRNRDVWKVLTRKPVTASEEEIRNNPRARSAKLRAAQLDF